MKIMMLGPGPDRIGKSAELDRFAVQACRFLKKEGHQVMWVDDNPSTLASTASQADRVYLEPLMLKRIEKIIEQERPDGLMYAFGGCLAAHLAIFLDREGVLDRFNVRILGTELSALRRFMDAEGFRRALMDKGVPFLEAMVVDSVDECIITSRSLGFPLILRPSFALEGIGGYLAYNLEEVKQLANLAINLSPVGELLLERAPADWVQFAVEAIHDRHSPGKIFPGGTFEALAMGVEVHPANSIVVAPALTLKGSLLQKALRFASIIASTTEICGSFQVRFALPPRGGEMVVLRVIHGLNRFSSLFSALGCLPQAEINAGLSLGYSIDKASEHSKTCSNQWGEPLPLAAARVPIFPKEFQGADILDSTMRAAGAALFLGNNLSEALIKAMDFMNISGLFEIKPTGPELDVSLPVAESADKFLSVVNSMGEADWLSEDRTPTGIDQAFFRSLQEGIRLSRKLQDCQERIIPDKLLREAKTAGFSDDRIASLTSLSKNLVRKARGKLEIAPITRIIPKPAGSRIGFISYQGGKEVAGDEGKLGPALVLLGPGPFRIGWGPEVDQALIQTALALKATGKKVVVINCNPDAASLDHESVEFICSELPTLEVIEALLTMWKIEGIVHQFCLELPDGLQAFLEEHRVPLLGTPYESMNVIRNVPELWKKLKALGVPVLRHAFGGDSASALRETANLGYPLLVRLSDRLLNPVVGIMYGEDMFRQFLDLHEECISEQNPIFMEIYQEGLVSAQMVALCDGKEATTLAFFENIEEYAIHSGDCASVVPSFSIGDLIRSSAEDILNSIVGYFQIVGHLQLELAIRNRNVYVTRVWPYPGWNTALTEKAVQQGIHSWVSQLFLGEKVGDLKISKPPRPQRFYVKEAVFPFSRFPSLNPVLSPRMQSMGQVVGIESSLGKAYFKAQMAVNPKISERGKVFISARDTEKEASLEVSKKLLKLGFSLISTEGTAQFLANRGIEVNVISKVSGGRPNVIDLIINGEISLVINIPGGVRSKRDEQAIYRATLEHNIPLITTTSGAYLFTRGIEEVSKRPLGLFPIIS